MFLKFTELPRLPRVSAVQGSTLKRVIFLLMVYETRHHRTFCVSQRQILSYFNRSKREVLGSYLKDFQSDKFFTKKHFSRGDRPDEYERGPYFKKRTRETDRILDAANALWNHKTGLLRMWPYPTAWGHGCLSPAAILILAVLQVAEEEIPRFDLQGYLTTFLTQDSFERGIAELGNEKLIFMTPWGFTIAPGWQHKLENYMKTTSSCCDRQISGDQRRQREIRENRERVAKGIVTHAEKTKLLDQPCIFCKSDTEPRTEMEHFPPKKFLRLSNSVVFNHRLLVSAIHNQCNSELGIFVRSLPRLVVTPGKLVLRNTDVDLNRIFLASKEVHQNRFHQAYRTKDKTLALFSIHMTLSLWLTIMQNIPHLIKCRTIVTEKLKN